MLGANERADKLYILDNNTISEIFRSYYREQFPAFWERFDELVRAGSAVSVRAVRIELENASRPEIVAAVRHLLDLNPEFFAEPGEQEQILVRQMTNDPALSAATSRWTSKAARGIEDADPYLIAKARVAHNDIFLAATVVTLEQENNPANIPAICPKFGVPCINLQQMMAALGWRF